MTVTALLPTLVMVVGGILYLLPTTKSAGVKQLAFAAFACGLLVTLLGLSGHTIHLP